MENKDLQNLNENELNEVSGGVYTGRVRRYTIQPGDTLISIARNSRTTVNVLCQLNGIVNPDRIRAYDVILVPDW